MNRTDRLYALVEELRARAPRMLRVTELAERFEVSTRTVERDLQALQAAGVPLRAQPGPGGGYGLAIETTLPPLNLTALEAAALATALAAAPAMPFAEAGRSALKKLAAVMAASPRDAATRLLDQVRVPQTEGRPSKSVSEVVQQGLVDKLAVRLRYLDAHGQETERVVEPSGLFGTHNGWYLAAWCRLRQAPRAFRLSRITEASLTREAIVPRPLDTLLADIPLSLAPPTMP